MNAFSSNPFVLPGMGQSGDAASNPLLASMEMMRKAFTSLTGPGGLNAGLQMTRAMDPDETRDGGSIGDHCYLKVLHARHDR